MCIPLGYITGTRGFAFLAYCRRPSLTHPVGMRGIAVARLGRPSRIDNLRLCRAGGVHVRLFRLSFQRANRTLPGIAAARSIPR